MSSGPVATNLIRALPHYRREAFDAGLAACGFAVKHLEGGHAPRPGDVLAIWNRYGTQANEARRYEAAGATVIVAENGYLGADCEGRQLYALAAGGHNGTGRWWPERLDGAARWKALGLDLAPWRAAGQHVLVCPAREFGTRLTATPSFWAEETAARLRLLTDRPVRVRQHPRQVEARGGKAVPLAEDLAGAWCVVVWGSTAGLRALLAGVPAVYRQPDWIGAPAASAELASVISPLRPDRLPMFERLACAQWTTEEIARGEPFAHLLRGRHLLSAAGQAQGA